MRQKVGKSSKNNTLSRKHCNSTIKENKLSRTRLRIKRLYSSRKGRIYVHFRNQWSNHDKQTNKQTKKALLKFRNSISTEFNSP